MQVVHSYWSPEAPQSTQPTLEGATNCDYVVIGGGVNGLSAAYHLRKAGADVILVERDAIGAQSSTKNFGVLTSVWEYHGYSLEDRRKFARFGEGSLEKVRAMIEREGIDCGLQRKEHWFIARSKGGRKLVIAEAEKLAELGYDCGFVEPEQLEVTRSPSFGGTYVNQYSLDPFRFIMGFKEAALRAGVRIYEDSPVTGIADGETVTVTTAGGTIRAKKAIIAANGFTGTFGVDTANISLPIQVFALATHPLPADVAASVGCGNDADATDMGTRSEADQRHWQRLRPDGTLLFGGGGANLPGDNILKPVPSQEKMRALVAEVRRRHPKIQEEHIRFFWGGTLSAPAGEKAMVGPLPGAKSIILVQCCYGHGMGVGANIGELVQELVAPGSVTDEDALAFLRYSAIGNSTASRIEGAVMKIATKGVFRGMLNRYIGAK